MSEKRSTGLIALVIKLGKSFAMLLPKLLTVFAKLFKSVVGTKALLAAAAFGGYSAIISWKFALAIMVCLGIHESGHVWAMRRQGMATRGFYFIPFIGGAAIADSAFPSAFAEGYIALMGPIWGLATALGTWLIGQWCTYPTNRVFEVAACWMCFVNLLNLIPIHPFDGGRVLRSLLMSVRGKTATMILTAMSLIGISFCLVHGYVIFVVFGLMGIFEFRAARQQRIAAFEASAMLRPDFERFIGWFKSRLGLPPESGFEEMRVRLRTLRKDPAWREDMDRLVRLRQQYKGWMRRWNALVQDMEKDWLRFSPATLFRACLYTPQQLETMLRQKETLQKAIGMSWVVSPRDSLGRPFWEKRVFSKKKLERRQAQRLERCWPRLLALVGEFREMLAEFEDVRPRILPGVQSVLGVESEDQLDMFAQVQPSSKRSSLQLPPELFPAMVKASRFSVFMGMPVVTRDAPMAYDESCFYTSSEIANIETAMQNPAILFERERKKAMTMLDQPYTGLLLIADPEAISTLEEKYRNTLPETEWGMTRWQNAAVAGAYVALTVALFSFMEHAGGYETAKHAVEFFKKF